MILLGIEKRFLQSYQDSLSYLEFSAVTLAGLDCSILSEVGACQVSVVHIFHVLQRGSRLQMASQSTGEGSCSMTNVQVSTVLVVGRSAGW